MPRPSTNSDRKQSVRGGRRLTAFVTIASLCGLFFAMLANAERGDPSMSNVPITVQVGEKADSFIRRNPAISNVDRQPAGLNFYELRWPLKSLGKVIISESATQFEIENVLSMTGVEDMDLQSEGISSFSINSTLTSSDLISHEEARAKTFVYLQKILKSGWKVVIPRGTARLRGKYMSDYWLRSKDYTSLDPSYFPTMEEWMKYEHLSGWKFYAGHVYLTVKITREHTLTDLTKPGSYLLSTELQSENEHFREYVAPLDRRRWKQLLIGAVEAMKKDRWSQETELRKQGIPIDTTYVDPPLPDQSSN